MEKIDKDMATMTKVTTPARKVEQLDGDAVMHGPWTRKSRL